ncbi:general substrate transporter [Crucibulum laeve]|uniref:General substrate transporter n=1 Tax=Crucibulum laeve TaxID=68775 RepID=A0A5C3LLT4_9AGAR|nr:general substrate transporter [Crucibulum laeve]
MSARDEGYIALSRSNDAEEGVRNADSNNPTEPLLFRSEGGPTPLIVAADGSYTYSYGPAGLSGLKHNKYALICALFASIGGLEFGYDQGVIANVLVMQDFMQRWPVTPLQKGIMTAVLELGALVGALAAGIFADRYSRGQAIIIACVIFLVGSLFQCAAQELSHIFIGRAVGGIGVGALSMLSPLYMAEISPPEVRGSLLALEQLSIVMGVVFGFWTGFATRDVPGSASWRIPLSLQVPPAILLALGALLLPPSPRLLVLQHREAEALSSLSRLRLRDQEDPLLQVELLEMKVEAELIRRAADLAVDEGSRKSGVGHELKAWTKLWDPKWRKRTLVGVGIMVFQQWSGINALLYYGPTLVRSIGFHGDTVSLVVAGGVGIVQFLAVLPAILFIDRVGRRPLLRGGSAVMTASHVSIALLVYLFQSDWPLHPVAAWCAVGGIYMFTAAYGTSFGPIGWVLPSEVFPLSMRSRGVALSTATNWFNNFLIGLITPVLMDLSAPTTFATFAFACGLAYFWSTHFVPETANVSLEEIDKVFRSDAGREDEHLKSQIEDDLGLQQLVRELAEG